MKTLHLLRHAKSDAEPAKAEREPVGISVQVLKRIHIHLMEKRREESSRAKGAACAMSPPTGTKISVVFRAAVCQ